MEREGGSRRRARLAVQSPLPARGGGRGNAELAFRREPAAHARPRLGRPRVCTARASEGLPAPSPCPLSHPHADGPGPGARAGNAVCALQTGGRSEGGSEVPKGTRGLGRKVRQKTQDIVPKGFNGLRITHACAPAVRSISGKVLSKWVTRARRGERNLEAGGCGRPGDPLFMLYHSPHVLNS